MDGRGEAVEVKEAGVFSSDELGNYPTLQSEELTCGLMTSNITFCLK